MTSLFFEGESDVSSSMRYVLPMSELPCWVYGLGLMSFARQGQGESDLGVSMRGVRSLSDDIDDF